MSTLQLTNKKRTLIFINIIITCIASSMLATALNTAISPIAADFKISVTLGQWMTSGYSLAMAIMMPLTAFLVTRISTKKLYCIAIGIFLTGLLLSMVATNFPTMMVGRVIQASGNGILSSMAQVIILTVFPLEKRGAAMGWYGLSIGAAPVIAPTIAGLLIDSVGWRAIFGIVFIILFISLIDSLIVFKNVLETEQKKFDIISFVLSAFTFGGLTLGVGNIGTSGIFSLQVIVCLVLGAISGGAFAFRQLNLDNPFLDLKILKDKEYRVSVIGSMLMYFVLMGSSIILPLYTQQILHQSATIAGLVTLPGSLAMTIISPFAGRIYDKLGIKILFVGGSLLLLISNAAMMFIALNTSIWVPALLNVLRCCAVGCLMMPLVTWGVGSVTKNKTPDATALLTSLRTISGAIGSAIFVAIMNYSTSSTNIGMTGVNRAYLGMTLATIVLLLLSFIGYKKIKF